MTRRRKLATLLDHASIRVHFEVMKAGNLNSYPPQRRQGFVHMTGVNQTAIGNEQGATKVKFTRQLTEAFDCAGANTTRVFWAGNRKGCISKVLA